MFVTITLVDQLQRDQKNPVEVIIKDSFIDVLSGLVYVRLGVICGDEEINKFFHRQLEIQTRMQALIDSSTDLLEGIGWSIEACRSEDDESVIETYILLEPTYFDVEMEEMLEDGEKAI